MGGGCGRTARPGAVGEPALPDPVAGAPTLAAAEPAPAVPAWPAERISTEALLADVAWLTAPERAGRGSFQAGGRAAADWLAARFRELGFEVVRQPIDSGEGGAGSADNVIGIRRGGEHAVLVSAHYDHLGVDGDGVVYPGADDNASGVAVMLAIARALGDARGGHTVVFVGFGAEEAGLLGSGAYVRDPVWPLERTLVLVNFDMVGRNFFEYMGAGQPGSVAVIGLEASAAHRAAARQAAEAEGLSLIAASGQFIARLGFDARTDDWWFRERGVATIHFSTGLHRDYHAATDTVERLRPDQLLRIARTAARLVAQLAELSS
jgi:Zn-dependent M28 family amino/carboxypeptidase